MSADVIAGNRQAAHASRRPAYLRRSEKCQEDIDTSIERCSSRAWVMIKHVYVRILSCLVGFLISINLFWYHTILTSSIDEMVSGTGAYR